MWQNSVVVKWTVSFQDFRVGTTFQQSHVKENPLKTAFQEEKDISRFAIYCIVIFCLPELNSAFSNCQIFWPFKNVIPLPTPTHTVQSGTVYCTTSFSAACINYQESSMEKASYHSSIISSNIWNKNHSFKQKHMSRLIISKGNF